MATEDATVPQLVESITQSSPSANCSVTMAGGDISSNAHTTNPCQKDSILDEQTRKDLFTDTFCRVCGAVLQSESQRSAHYEGKKHAQKLRLYLLKKELQGTSLQKENVDRIDYIADHGASRDKNKFCSLCNMVFSSPVVAQSHYVGKIHAKKMRQLGGDQAEWTPQADHACSPVTSQADAAAPPVADYSPSSPVVEKSTPQDANTEQQSSTDNEVDLTDPDKYCKLCCASFNKPLVALQHYSGKKHARNVARKRMMEEMEESGDPLECVVSDGKYVCPICSVTLTSIEMYQAHMQGNKHQVKETMVTKLMNTSKKSYNSFQEELADYIKVQKARGLEPKTQFRQERDQYDSCDYDEEELEERPPPVYKHTNNIPYKYHDQHSFFYPPFNALHPAKHMNPPLPSPWENPHHNTPRGHHRMPTSSSSSSSDDSEGSSSDHSSGSYRKDRRHRRKHHKDSKHRSRAKIRRENDTTERKKKKVDEANSGRDDDKQCKKEETRLSAVDKSKHKKEKRKREEQSVDKEAKKHKKPKKEEVQKTEEEILWDESILGF
ncbi:lysine-rich coiled-coil protein 1 [Spea bombifrons]|uniref:lysine-rich coiled-coil protein 1 n=1 Tax=Spea bombifrons TaxID=233779 RepID=UPI00234A3EA2|nr:lysine-rich coiled-coil protein 1 [Spea bombifrons]